MKKIKYVIIRTVGFLNVFAGIVYLAPGVLGFLLYIITSVFSGFKNVPEYSVIDNLKILLLGSIYFIGGICMLTKKGWGRIGSILFLSYSIIYPILTLIRNFKYALTASTSKQVVLLSLNATYLLFLLVLLYFFIHPSIRHYYTD